MKKLLFSVALVGMFFILLPAMNVSSTNYDSQHSKMEYRDSNGNNRGDGHMRMTDSNNSARHHERMTDSNNDTRRHDNSTDSKKVTRRHNSDSSDTTNDTRIGRHRSERQSNSHCH